MSEPLIPLRCLSAVSVLDQSASGWSLADEQVESDGARHAVQHISFDAPFSAPPIIHIGIVGLDTSREHNTRLRVRATDVTAFGFSLTAETWFASRVWSVDISWLAVGV